MTIATPTFLATPLLKLRSSQASPLFLNLVGGSTTPNPPPPWRKGGCTLCSLRLMYDEILEQPKAFGLPFIIDYYVYQVLTYQKRPSSENLYFHYLSWIPFQKIFRNLFHRLLHHRCIIVDIISNCFILFDQKEIT